MKKEKIYYNLNDEKFFDNLTLNYNLNNQTIFLLKAILKHLKNNHCSYESFTPEGTKKEIYINCYLYDFINFLESIFIYDINILFI